MAKKKNQDFSKIKVKIGKAKPSKNVTKFNIKTSKVVIPGDNPNKVLIKKVNDNFFSTEKNDLSSNLYQIDAIVTEYLSKKRAIQQSHQLDLTQSIWPTFYYPRWLTPWDTLLTEFVEKMGPLEQFMSVMFDNAESCDDKSVKEGIVRTVSLYLDLTGDSSAGSHIARKVLSIAKSHFSSTARGKRLLGLELLSSVAKHSPGSLWHHSRRRACAWALETIQYLFKSARRTHDRLLDETKVLQLTNDVLTAATDGRRRGLIIAGDDSSQLNDMATAPFREDILYISEHGAKEAFVVANVTDCTDGVDSVQFDLDKNVGVISDELLTVGLTLLPVATDCLENVQKALWTVQTLSRCCLATSVTNKWSEFANGLIEGFPYVLRVETVENDEASDDAEEDYEDDVALSKKDRKLRKQRLELAAKMRELCRKAKTVKDVKGVHRLNDDLNYHTVALVHQCLVAGKIDITDSFNDWLNRLETFLGALDRSRNEAAWRWMVLAKQIMRLTFERSCVSAMPLCQVLATFSHDLFLSSHPLSRTKRISLVVFVEFCLGSIQFVDPHNLPSMDTNVLDHLIALIIENGAAIGRETPHPMFVSTQTHYDITLPRALHMLLVVDYPGVAPMINRLDAERAAVIKTVLSTMRQEIMASEYPRPQRQWNLLKREHLSHVPSKFYWDYFTFDDVHRKDAVKQRLATLCSSVASFMIK